jgi:hypothetical protein
MVRDINKQKDIIKKNGILIDGRIYKVEFKGIVCLMMEMNSMSGRVQNMLL